MLTLIMYYSAGVKINLISRGNRSPSFGPRSANCNLIATVRTIAKFANILSAHSKNRIPRCKDIQTHKSTYIIRLIFPSPERSGVERSPATSHATLRVRYRWEPGPGPMLGGALVLVWVRLVACSPTHSFTS